MLDDYDALERRAFWLLLALQPFLIMALAVARNAAWQSLGGS